MFLNVATLNLQFKNFVITAAHCCADQNKDQLQVVAGDHNIKLDEGTEQVSP